MDERAELPRPVDRVAPMTEQLLRDAGVGPGMRVLDVGCGRADVTLMIASLVGEAGQVVGLDRSEEALTVARARVQEQGLTNVELVVGDLNATTSDDARGYDAIVGRRVLMYQSDRAAAMRALSGRLRPGGLAVFQEIDTTMVPAPAGSHPVHERLYRWLWATVEHEGATTSMGFELPGVFEAAGLVLEGLRAEGVVQTAERPHVTAWIARMLESRIVAAGVATSEDIDVDSLPRRLAEELRRADRPFIGEMMFGAWARKPA